MRSFRDYALVIVTVASVVFVGAAQGQDAEFRIGMIGLDTSHVIAFTKTFNDPNAPDHVPGFKVVAAFKGGSSDIESSYSRVEGYTQQLRDEFGVKIVDTIEELCTLVDGIMLESVDGRPHLEQARPVFKAGLPLFIDKPVAGSLADAIEIFRLSKEHNVPCWSSSSYRYYPGLVEMMQKDFGELRGAISYGPASIEEHHPDLFWYGVHATEALFTVMGPGVQTVVRTHTDNTDVVTGVWEGGKVGTLRGLREQAAPNQVIIFGTKEVLLQGSGGGYGPMLVEIAKFFKTREVPVSPRETIEIFAFMEAADESKRQGGVPVSVAEVLEKASGGKPLPYEVPAKEGS
ncbi:MAG TPA: Gfo/Idh/MocA family oxidoreductase [Candidatus Hydrogenedentes bacterium]|nr:Gfo/Idh/MocA family oxidoreductase [Candidatus Hydrogenedentota bacterium]HQH52519.1 Gfo/Idh/MocA family oxidoreductase [Candidatus Hydrogenedentota bacterium]HQM50260.1 Gfo/Idh/MocA family oxidoreductase [Candidatus Hydrogenedentota bacterium]